MPKGAKPIKSEQAGPNTQICEFVIAGTIADLQAFYYDALPIGGFIQLETEQGSFFEAGIYGASCTREIIFDPSKVAGEILLRLTKHIDYNTLAVLNALSKQIEPLRSLELFFGFSIPDCVQLKGPFRTSEKSGSQYLLSGSPPDKLLQFFRTQILGARPIYMPADSSGTPHILMDLEAGIAITVAAKPTADGTLISLSRSWNPKKTDSLLGS